MAREFSVIVSINAAKAAVGARQFNVAANTVVRGSAKMTTGLKAANASSLKLITTIGRIRGVATLAFAGFLGVGGIGAIVRTLTLSLIHI